ncbi:MAG: alpha/beta hydrolase [Gammaproteobacteria bacterium]|nr:alpha/beta hydrolase [Gammaproteobacteria bacterium]
MTRREAPALVETETLIYGRVDGFDLLAEHYRAAQGDDRAGKAVVMVHGGAWTSNDRHSPEVLCRDLASRGLSVFSLDFRDGRNGKHPCAVQDITAGVRYVRARAAAFDIDPDRIGLIGSSSGGHLVLLAAIQPDVDAHRGTPIHADVDAESVSARVCCVVALWPVSDPLFRFRYAQHAGRAELVAAHRRYYRDEAHMHQASVQRTLRAGRIQCLPPALVVQPGEDANVPRPMTLELVREYQDAGGSLNYLFYPGLPHAFAYQASAETSRLADQVQAFLALHMLR